MNERGLLVIISAPSGCGKSTIIAQLMSMRENFSFSISATTRSPRIGEQDGKHYFFVSKEQFTRMIDEDAFLEHAVYVDNYYGTPKGAVQEKLDAGIDVILDIEVKGALQVMEKCPDALSIFIMPPSFEELESRLVLRGVDSEEVIKHRLEAARLECLLSEQYDYTVINDELFRATAEINDIISAEKFLRRNRPN